MRPELNGDLIKKVAEKWKLENRLTIDVPTSRVIEDVLLKYMEGSIQKSKDKRRGKIFGTFVMMKSKIRHSPRQSLAKINSLGFGSIKINGKKYNNDVIVSYKGTVKEIETQMRHLISKNEFTQLLLDQPETILVGTGVEGDMQVSSDVLKIAQQKGIKIVDVLSKDAVKKFNSLCGSGKKVSAFIHTTC
jgi:hypothetical protein